MLPRALTRTSDRRAIPARMHILGEVRVAGFRPVELLSGMINSGTLSAV